MPAAELQETGRIPPNAHHSMPEYGCRPCSGLDPPRIKKVGAPCRRRPERKWTRHAGDARKERSVDLRVGPSTQRAERRDARRPGWWKSPTPRSFDDRERRDLPRERRRELDARGGAAAGQPKKSKQQNVNKMRHRRRARPRRSARATDHSNATIDLTGVGANASYPRGRFAAIDPRTGARQSRAEAAESSRRFDHQARHQAGFSCGSLGPNRFPPVWVLERETSTSYPSAPP